MDSYQPYGLFNNFFILLSTLDNKYFRYGKIITKHQHDVSRMFEALNFE